MENVVSVIFTDECKAYRALSTLRHSRITEGYAVLEAAIVAREKGKVVFWDGFGTQGSLAGEWTTGGLLGSMIGIFAGPLGVLLERSIDSIISMPFTHEVAEQEMGLIQSTLYSLDEGQMALVSIVQENNVSVFNYVLSQLGSQFVCRYDVIDVEAEIDQSYEVERELQREARQRMNNQRQAYFKNGSDDVRDRIRHQFDQLKQNF